MSTESETKSAGVPAGATHVCTKCGQYWARGPGKALRLLVRVVNRDCECGDGTIKPIAEAGPAPTTAAPAEQPACVNPYHLKTGDHNGKTCYSVKEPMPPGDRARALISAAPAAPAEQLSGKVVCDAHAGIHERAHDCDWPRLLRTVLAAAAEQPGKAADPRPGEVLCDKPSYKHGGSHPQKATCVDPRPAQPQAPAEPMPVARGVKSAVVIPLGDGLPPYRAAPYCPWCGHKEHVGTCGAWVAVPACAGFGSGSCGCDRPQHWICEHENPAGLCPTCTPVLRAPAAPLREERDRLAAAIEQLTGDVRAAAGDATDARRERDAERAKVAERDARIKGMRTALERLIEVAQRQWDEKPAKASDIRRIQEARAALGAPEGQPERCPGSMQPSGLPITTTARNVPCPVCFQLVGFYGVGSEYMVAIHNRPSHMPPAAPSEAPLDALRARLAELKRDMDAYNSDEDNFDLSIVLEDVDAVLDAAALSAPPPPTCEKQELLGKEGGRFREKVREIADTVRDAANDTDPDDAEGLLEALMETAAALDEALAPEPAPSSPEEQLSGKELK